MGGKLIRQSLHTSTYSVAVLRLNDLLKENRGRVEAREATRSGPMTFREAADDLLRQIDADPSVKPATRDYRRRCLEALLRSWPDLPATDVRRITARQCQDWAAVFAERYSPTMYNNTVGLMNAAMSSLLRRLRSERPDDSPLAAVMKIEECQKTMERTCQELGLDRMTHHDLRHFFATSCIEAGIDIPTVSRWLGHKDGGALAMRVYGHLRDQHSQAMAQRVTFGAPAFDSPRDRSAEPGQP